MQKQISNKYKLKDMNNRISNNSKSKTGEVYCIDWHFKLAPRDFPRSNKGVQNAVHQWERGEAPVPENFNDLWHIKKRL